LPVDSPVETSYSGLKVLALIIVVAILVISCICLYKKWHKNKNGMSKLPEAVKNNEKVTQVNNSEMFSARNNNEPGFSSSPDKNNNFQSSPDSMHFEVVR
jgi:hypothetical protein